MGSFPQDLNTSTMKALFRIKSEFWRIALAEFAGTFLLMAFGDGSVAQSVLSNGSKGDFFSINWGYGIAVMMGVYATFGVSGGHLNPAVTVAMAVAGKLDYKKIPAYLIGQYLGAFAGATAVFAIYYEKIIGADAQLTMATAGIFSTYPSADISQVTGFFDQILGTGLLLFCVRGITDDKNAKVLPSLQPFLIGLIVVNIGIAFGFNCGYAINPARDLSPRLLTLMIGYGTETFSAHNFWFYVPVLATHIGAIIGCLLYDVLLGWHLNNADDDAAKGVKNDIAETTVP